MNSASNLLRRLFHHRPTMADLATAISNSSANNMVRILRQFRSQIPCKDCKRVYSWKVMTFDHLDRGLKTRGVMQLATSSGKAKLLEELAKCELVCLNCHKLREYERDYAPMTEADIKRRIGAGIKL